MSHFCKTKISIENIIPGTCTLIAASMIHLWKNNVNVICKCCTYTSTIMVFQESFWYFNFVFLMMFVWSIFRSVSPAPGNPNFSNSSMKRVRPDSVLGTAPPFLQGNSIAELSQMPLDVVWILCCWFLYTINSSLLIIEDDIEVDPDLHIAD